MNRRTWLMAGAGGAATAAGLGWQLWRSTGGGGGAPLDEATMAFWQASFNQPDGQTLAMASLYGQPLVLNFWATWCPPCVREMPELDRFAQAFARRGGRVVGLAVDNPTAVREFLTRTPVSYPIGLAGLDGSTWARRLGNSQGALPFTAVFNRHGAIVRRKLGETHQAELTLWTDPL